MSTQETPVSPRPRPQTTPEEKIIVPRRKIRMNQKGYSKLGYIFVILGGVIAIALSVWFSKSAGPLWAIIPVYLGFRFIESDTETTYRGLILGILYVVIGIAAFYIQNAYVLWALFLANITVGQLPNK